MATTQRLTDDQIAATVDAMRMPDAMKATLKAHALAGEPGARFTVMGAYRLQSNPDARRDAVAAWAERSA